MSVARSWEAEEHRFLELMARFDCEADSMPLERRLEMAANIETGRRWLRESKERIATLLAGLDAHA